MKLLIITQVVDTQHPVLGFFHRWIAEFANHCEHIHVIALQVGTHDLPANVTVHTLGKELGNSRWQYLWRFYRSIWMLRREYDGVFVHMNQIYVILGASLWRLWGKQVGLWYAHGTITNSLRLAVRLSHIVFTSTPQGMRIKTNKLAIVGQGIDPEQFTVSDRPQTDTLQLITVGRISQSKNIETLLRAVAAVKASGEAVSLQIIGSASTTAEVAYEQVMRDLTTSLGIDDVVEWVGPVAYENLPSMLATADVFIHDGSTNSLDKTLPEAAFAGCVVLSSNPAYRDLTEAIAPEFLFAPKDYTALATMIESVARDMNNAKNLATSVRQQLVQSCSLSGLVSGIVGRY